MALSLTTTIGQIRDLVEAVTGLAAVYAPSETDGNRVPAAFNDLPCALVLPGPSLAYILSSGQHRHTYEVKVQIFEAPGGDTGEAANTILPMIDALIEKFAVNVGLANAGGANPRANSCIFSRHSGYVGMEYGGITYLGFEVILDVSEQASATPALGT
jgi:hypothetical protein